MIELVSIIAYWVVSPLPMSRNDRHLYSRRESQELECTERVAEVYHKITEAYSATHFRDIDDGELVCE